MARWKYSPLAQDESGKTVQNKDQTYDPEGENDSKMINQRMPYCLGIMVLLAIVYVLSRTENVGADCPTIAGGVSFEDFDIGAYRSKALANTPPHIIECKEAEEGASQDICHISREKRFAALGQKGVTLWMTGLSGSGKSTIAKALEEKLVLEYGKHVYRLDGDNIRTGLNRDLGFSPADRAESVRRVGEISALMADGGVISIVSLVSPYKADRDDARKRHEDQNLKFLEVFMDVPLEVVSERDPKGLYKKVAAGELKGFTGVDAPYEPPTNPEVNMPNYKMTLDESVDMLMKALREHGILEGGADSPDGLPLPDGDEIVDLHVPANLVATRKAEAATLPKALITDMDLNWLQTVGEGWAAPLKGFMREGTLLQTLHFNSILVDPYNVTGNYAINEKQTPFDELPSQPPLRVSMSVPIVLPCTGYTKHQIEKSGKKAVALTDKDGKTWAILRNPEIYENRKEEIVARMFGVIDPGHPYIAHINSGGDYLIGGEIELLERIRYNDGLDQYRLTLKELRAEFAKKNADIVYAFQTRNPTHAGHAYLMKEGRNRLLREGYKNPVLWLSPLGGWTKEDDVPLDVRVKQHVAVLEEGMLDPAWTVMAIWPSPMVYAGPTEVIFHAKSRRNGGASYFVVGRDPAGMKGSELALAHPDDDLYNGDHGRYVLQMSPGLGQDFNLLGFTKVYYDVTDHQMKVRDESRVDDFISISGSKMRALARQGATPCPNEIPNDLLEANCVPPGFMVPTGWQIVCDYYQHVDSNKWVPWSKPIVNPPVGPHVEADGQYGSAEYQLFFQGSSGAKISPWHDIPLYADEAQGLFNFVVEIPMYTTAKMEVSKEHYHNPIMQDESKGKPRYYNYGTPFFNYGLLPQTWEDPMVKDAFGNGGDNDPLDVMEIGSSPIEMGSVVPIKVLGSLELIDEGETDHKIIAIRADDPDARYIHDMDSLESVKPGIIADLIDWLKMYKTADGKGVNSLAQEEPTTRTEALEIIRHTNERWTALRSGEVLDTGFFLG
mmetsp:Transcript_13168/g.20061  ORF Transcript_13168/g.20061 Transcript_13168/m.20061 type:complete len:1009 (+) Transcript_13168:60-3086(+)